MPKELQEQIVTALLKNMTLGCIYKNLQGRIDTGDPAALITSLGAFHIDRETKLLYMWGKDNNKQLCVLAKKHWIFLEETHDKRGHLEQNKIQAYLHNLVFILQMKKLINRYVSRCLVCFLAKSKTHKPWGWLLLIEALSKPLQVLMLDFVIKLPESARGNNCFLIVTDKFSKAVWILAGKETDTA